MPVPCCASPPCGFEFGSSRTHGRATTWHGSGPLWSFGFLCFLLSHGGLNGTYIAHYCAISKSPQCLPLIDSLIGTSLIMRWLLKCTKNIKECSLPTNNKSDQEWEELRNMFENWLLGVTLWIVVRATTTVIYGTVVIVMVVVMVVVIVIVMVIVVFSSPWPCPWSSPWPCPSWSSSSSPPHPCKDMDAKDPRKSAASQWRVVTWISFKNPWDIVRRRAACCEI